MTSSKNGVDQKLIRDLASILDETHLTEIEVEQGNMRVRVSRQPLGGVAAAPQQIVPPTPVTAPQPAEPRVKEPSEAPV